MKDLKFPTRKEVGAKELRGAYLFVVEVDSTISEVTVKDSLGFGLDEGVVKRLLETKMPVAIWDGEPRRMRYQLPLHIKLPKK